MLFQVLVASSISSTHGWLGTSSKTVVTTESECLNEIRIINRIVHNRVAHGFPFPRKCMVALAFKYRRGHQRCYVHSFRLPQ
ncbi:hypothetical protein GGR57DRAFT_467633 [Xylariaceae sp. FL1272]|nr:hypothetical protein GGR57DRAFT_467633 [Xylariaceae sp. FL1272]